MLKIRAAIYFLLYLMQAAQLFFLILDLFKLIEMKYSKKNTSKKILFINDNFGKNFILRIGQQKNNINNS